MTIETKTTIDLADIQAVEYKCSKCGTSTLRPLSESHKVPLMCGNCNAMWMSDGGNEGTQLRAFISFLHTFATYSNSNVQIRLSVRGLSEREDAKNKI